MIDPTDELVDAYETARRAYWTALAHESPVGGLTVAGHGRQAQRQALKAALVVFAASVEGKRGEGLCDCDGTDDDPISPVDGDQLEHHCECRAVLTAGVLLSGSDKTKHAARCLCGRTR